MDEATFREVCGYFATGVSIVTMRDGSGENGGFTANSFTSVSLNPPLVLVCVDKQIASHPQMIEADGWMVNILTDDQEWLARQFANPDIEKFAGVPTESSWYDAPRFSDCLAYLGARSRGHLDGGDHTIFIGEVTDSELGGGAPLIFYRGMYGVPRGTPLQ